MGLKPDTTDEISGTSRSLIEIPLPLSESVARMYIGRVLAMIVITGTVVVLVVATLYFESLEPFLRPLPAFLLCFLLLGILALLRPKLFLPWASHPGFAIGKDGIRIRDAQGERFYEWQEVSHCHWSHSEPGMLNIQANANPDRSNVALPPTRLYYRVPESYRPAVEKAIRAMGRLNRFGHPGCDQSSSITPTDST